MARRMLINAIHPEECRVAICEDDHLLELEIERADQAQLKGNIYKASITRIEPSLQAGFLDIGSQRNGFLQINDINPAYFLDWPPQDGHDYGRPSIQDVLHSSQELVVQVVKDERDLKGATLTTNLSIPGRYLVLMIGSQRGGVSRKIVDESQRFKLKQAVQKLEIPPGMGVIVRTAGINRSSVELQRDLDSLLDTWYEILKQCQEPGTPKLLYKESDLAIRTIRDYLTSEIDEILIDERVAFERAHQFVEKIMPSFAEHVIFYENPRPLFSNFHLDSQVDAINQPEVTLHSGGSIVINMTEAIVAVDVNSGRSTGQADVEETAFNTNKEAAETIARQLRLRDLGGLVVIDFIDMLDKRHKQIVERVLKDATRTDKAKVEIGRISKFGLLEMSRQRLKTSLVSQSHSACPHCLGRGRVKTPESAALEALRKIESAVFAGGLTEVRVRMAPAAALFLLNEKRHTLTAIETAVGVAIKVYADGRMRPEEYELSLETGRREAPIVVSESGSPRREGHSSPPRRPSRDRNQRSDNRRGGGAGRRQDERQTEGHGERQGGERQGGERQRDDNRGGPGSGGRRRRRRRGRDNWRQDRGGQYPREGGPGRGEGEARSESEDAQPSAPITAGPVDSIPE